LITQSLVPIPFPFARLNALQPSSQTFSQSLLDKDNNNDAVSSPDVMDIFVAVIKGLREQLILTFLVSAALLASFPFLLILLGGWRSK
jgi:hypothetical protein